MNPEQMDVLCALRADITAKLEKYRGRYKDSDYDCGHGDGWNDAMTLVLKMLDARIGDTSTPQTGEVP